MPYWAYHVSQKGPVVLRGEKSKRRGDYIYTDHFNINGDMDCQYKGISFDASSSFDDNISEAHHMMLRIWRDLRRHFLADFMLIRQM